MSPVPPDGADDDEAPAPTPTPPPSTAAAAASRLRPSRRRSRRAFDPETAATTTSNSTRDWAFLLSGFSSWGDYASAVRRAACGGASLRRLLLRRSAEEQDESRMLEGGYALRPVAGAFQVAAFGVGLVVGSGVFTTSAEGMWLTGPSVLIAYLLAGAAALLSTLVYAELAVELPFSGEFFPVSGFGFWPFVLKASSARARTDPH